MGVNLNKHLHQDTPYLKSKEKHLIITRLPLVHRLSYRTLVSGIKSFDKVPMNLRSRAGMCSVSKITCIDTQPKTLSDYTARTANIARCGLVRTDRTMRHIRIEDNIRRTTGDVPSFVRFRSISFTCFPCTNPYDNICVLFFEYLLLPLPRLVEDDLQPSCVDRCTLVEIL